MSAAAVEQALGAHTVIARPLVYQGQLAGFELVDLSGHPVTGDEQYWLDHLGTPIGQVRDADVAQRIADAINDARVAEHLEAVS